MKKLATLLILTIVCACNSPKESDGSSKTVFGNFAAESYAQRSEGYDYVTVSIDSINDQFASVIIDARKDKKSPTCELEVFARIVDENTIEFETVGSNTAVIQSTPEGIVIKTKDESKIDDLSFYCSGGATLADEYLSVDLAESSEDFWNSYPQSFELQGIEFNLYASSNFMFNQILVEPSGLEITNRSEVIPFQGQFELAEIEDLNADGWPELLAMIRSNEGKMSVIGYSVNNGKSMSMIQLPALAEDDPNASGYMGQDEIRVVENMLVRRFPIYENGKATEKFRQLQYKLVDGEASRVFELDKVTEY